MVGGVTVHVHTIIMTTLSKPPIQGKEQHCPIVQWQKAAKYKGDPVTENQLSWITYITGLD
jgi:hypothetical protein